MPENDYLWDGSGEPDPEVQRLEMLLGRLRSDRPPPPMPQPVVEPRARGWRWLLPRLAAASALVIVAALVWVAVPRPRPGWEVARLEGKPLVGQTPIEETGKLPVGEWLETDSASRARLHVGSIGQLEVEPNTRLRLLRARLTDHRVSLARGTIHALIWAPPRLFYTETPSAVAVDLGCAYSLEVDDAGGGLLSVTYGWVGFERDGRESFVPAGAHCRMHPDVGPGTPYYGDATETLRTALAKFDFEQGEAEALNVVLAETRPRDAFTLWHLLWRTDETQRARVYDRLADLVPPPKGVTREAVLKLNRRDLDQWWDALGLGDTLWWRFWKGPYPGGAAD